MTNENPYIKGWKDAEHFSGKFFFLQMEVDRLQDQNKYLLKAIDELRAENQRLQQIAQY